MRTYLVAGSATGMIEDANILFIRGYKRLYRKNHEDYVVVISNNQNIYIISKLIHIILIIAYNLL